ncbi:MAG: D-hexose-6-phosphate mutarotase [Verrucomicrobia bacterium]|nr:D-hexose-6-phosphate mutarotase [Verrucomicrobiota bacterium]
MTPIIIQTSEAEANIYQHGAHIAHFQPSGHKPVLFMSAKSWFEPDKPIRGGVPICFPWFGPGRDPAAPKTPMHGLARLRKWVIERTTANSMLFSLALPPFEAKFNVEIGPALKMAFEVRNTGAQPEQFEAALHTYLAVGDIREVTVTGLENTEYLDNLAGLARKREGSEPIRFTGETDRVYLDTRATCVVHDPVLKRKLIVEKKGSDATVVWNPWIAKAKAMPDFGDDEWPYMLCIETANCKQHAVTLAPGTTHKMAAVVTIQ